MNEVRLKDLRRAIEDYKREKQKLESCDKENWDGCVTAFKQLLVDNRPVGVQFDELLKHTEDAAGAIQGLFTELGGECYDYTPPANVQDRLSLWARLLLDAPSNKLTIIGFMLNKKQRSFSEAFNAVRERLQDLLDEVEVRLDRKLEDLEEQNPSNAAMLSFNQIYIFGDNVGLSTGSGNVTFNLQQSILAQGEKILETEIGSLKAMLTQIMQEQDRAAMLADAGDSITSRKLDLLLEAVKGKDLSRALSIFDEFKAAIGVSKIAESCGNIVDVITFVLMVLKLCGMPGLPS